MKMHMLMMAGAIALVSSGAFAQPSQSQGGAQAGTNGNGANAPGAAMQRGTMGSDTTGMNSGMQSGTKSSGPNGSAGDRPTAKGGPAGGDPSTSSSTPK